MEKLKFDNPLYGKFKNACYANAVTQVLSVVPIISDYYMTKRFKETDNEYPVSEELSRLLTHHGHMMSTSQLREAVGKVSKKGYFFDGTQQDASEFLMELICTLNKETSSSMNQGFLDRIVKGKLTYQRGFLETQNGSCNSCGSFVNPQDEIFHILALPARSASSPSVQSLLDGNFEEIEMRCPNSLCVDNSIKRAGQSKVIVELPKVLFLTVAKEFHLQVKAYPLEETIHFQGVTFKLVGLVDHQGRTAKSGHYIAWKKVNSNWYKCDDSVITEVNLDVIPSNNNYMFVYLRNQPNFITS